MRLCSLTLLSSALILTAGCSPKEEEPGIGSGGTADQITTDTEDSGIEDSGLDTAPPEDTGEDLTDDGWPEADEANGPSQRNPDCFFEDFPNIGWVINCYVEIRDSQENLDGGTLELTASGGEFGKRASAEFEVGTFDGDACEACIDGEQATGAEMNFAVPVQGTSDTYELVWMVKDKQGNRSNELEVIVE